MVPIYTSLNAFYQAQQWKPYLEEGFARWEVKERVLDQTPLTPFTPFTNNIVSAIDTQTSGLATRLANTAERFSEELEATEEIKGELARLAVDLRDLQEEVSLLEELKKHNDPFLPATHHSLKMLEALFLKMGNREAFKKMTQVKEALKCMRARLEPPGRKWDDFAKKFCEAYGDQVKSDPINDAFWDWLEESQVPVTTWIEVARPIELPEGGDQPFAAVGQYYQERTRGFHALKFDALLVGIALGLVAVGVHHKGGRRWRKLVVVAAATPLVSIYSHKAEAEVAPNAFVAYAIAWDNRPPMDNLSPRATRGPCALTDRDLGKMAEAFGVERELLEIGARLHPQFLQAPPNEKPAKTLFN